LIKKGGLKMKKFDLDKLLKSINIEIIIIGIIYIKISDDDLE
jgi:hypothetical protein